MVGGELCVAWRLVLALLAGSASAQAIPLGAKTLPVSLSRVVFDLAPVQVLGERRGGLFCLRYGEVKWRDGRMDVDDNIFRSRTIRSNRAWLTSVQELR